MYERIRKELDGEGELPLLTASQLSFLDEVIEVVDRKVDETARLYLKYEANQNEEVLHVISDSETHLMNIVRRLKSARKSKLRFVETYPKWKAKREDCIAKLTEIANSINSDRFNCNVSKLVGYCTSAVGGGVALASAVLIPFSFGLTTPLAVAGGSMIFAGCGTTIGTSITEIALLKSKVDQAKKLIDEDKEYFEDLSEWLTHASALQDALQSVLGIDVFRDVADSIKKFVHESVKIKNDRDRHNKIERFITQILKTVMPEFTSRAVPIIAIATFITVLVTIFLLLINTDNRVVFDFASVTIRSILGVASLLDDSMDIIRLSSLFPGSAAVAKDFAKAATRGAVAVVGMALDVIGIVFVSKDIHAGSLSPEAEKINDAVKNMKDEADVLARMYNNLEIYNNHRQS